MKNSYYRTPRCLDECTFVTGYRPAQPRDWLADAGHVVLNLCCVLGIFVMVPVLVFGVL
jgi:hypothetical protein